MSAFPWAAAGAVLDVAGGLIGQQKDWSAQKKMAQRQIQWRVEDARLAGIHPLYAMGITPVTGGATYMPGDNFTQAGQDISRARAANMDRDQRAKEAAIAAVMTQREQAREDGRAAAEIQESNARTDLIRAQIIRTNKEPYVGPGWPNGSADRTGMPDPQFQPQASMPVVESRHGVGQEPGRITDFGWVRGSDGGLRRVFSDDFARRTEDDWIARSQWYWRNQVVPFAHGGRGPNPEEHPLPRGWRWEWDWDRQAWYGRNIRTRQWMLRE